MHNPLPQIRMDIIHSVNPWKKCAFDGVIGAAPMARAVERLKLSERSKSVLRRVLFTYFIIKVKLNLASPLNKWITIFIYSCHNLSGPFIPCTVASHKCPCCSNENVLERDRTVSSGFISLYINTYWTNSDCRVIFLVSKFNDVYFSLTCLQLRSKSRWTANCLRYFSTQNIENDRKPL